VKAPLIRRAADAPHANERVTMDVVILLGLLIVIGTVISFYKKPFRAYWIFSLVTATVLALLYQLFAYLEAGYLDPFFKIAFVVSWIAFFVVASIGYGVYRLARSRKTQQDAAGRQL
jgi:uncharacterized membrane protein (UPF0136 family)